MSVELSVENLLLDWGFEKYVEIFKENEVDIDALKLLDDAQLVILIPAIGPQVKFKKALSDWKASQLKSGEILQCDDDLHQMISNYGDSLGGLTPSLTSQIPSTPASPSPSPSSVSSHTQPYEDRTAKTDDNTAKNNETAKKSKDVFHKENNRTSLDGRAILREGQVGGGILKEGSRRKLSQLLISDILENNTSRTINTEEFYSLTTEICQLFTKESAVVYYSAYVASADGVKKKNASGKLYESYICRRRKLREIGDLPKSNRSSSVSSASTRSSSISLLPEQSEEDHQENIAWLKNNVEPWETVQKNWRETEGLRLNKIKAGEGKIEDYFKDFPALQQQQGHTLLLNDFDRMYPGKSGNLYSKILLKEEILKYAGIKLKATRDKYVNNTLRELLSLVDDTNPETSTNVALMVLPLVINVSPTRKQKKPTWKPSRAEISQGFITQAANEGEVSTLILEKIEKFKKLGRTVQPYVIFAGSSAVEIRKAYVVINNTLYSFQKLITAVDCAFKIFQATGAYYPEESEDIWTSIQIGMYGITTKFDRKTQAVNVVLADLELIE